jgi:hypothetical protein
MMAVVDTNVLMVANKKNRTEESGDRQKIAKIANQSTIVD